MDQPKQPRRSLRALEQLHSDEAMALNARNFYRRAVADLEAKLAEKRTLLDMAEANYQHIRDESEREQEARLVPLPDAQTVAHLRV